jgi:LAO/AO transport system kinase
MMSVQAIAEGVLAGNRRALARAVTLVESGRSADAVTVGEIMRRIRAAAPAREVVKPRIAISGPPGTGKSCFIEALGMHLIRSGMSVAVLAVDPSSRISGGSLLGDKTRMTELSCEPRAYVRPSPSRGCMGGVTAQTGDAIELFEAANFDVTLVETVGVGQSEIAARDLTDVFVLLVPPLGGDDLQGAKKGIVEVADAIYVTKADEGPQRDLARAAANAYRRSVLLSATDCHNPRPVGCVSAATGWGIDEAWTTLRGIFDRRLEGGEVAAMRNEQRMRQFHTYFEHTLVQRAKTLLGDGQLVHLEDTVIARGMTPREAGEFAVNKLFKASA